MAYCEEYTTYKFQRSYIRNSLDTLCCDPCHFNVDTLYETIKEYTPDMIKGCHTNRVKKILREWLEEAQSKQKTKELIKAII